MAVLEGLETSEGGCLHVPVSNFFQDLMSFLAVVAISEPSHFFRSLFTDNPTRDF